MPILYLVVLILIGAGWCSVPSPTMAAELHLTTKISGRSEQLRKFLNRLYENIHLAYPKISQDWGIDRFETGERDLNGDGIPELFVGYGSTFFSYGNSGRSMVSIYEKRDNWWAYVGQVTGRGTPSVVQIESENYNDWEIIRYAQYYYCYLDSKDPIEDDIFLTPYNKNSAGYRKGIGNVKPCP